jgi:hypothetical protein
VVSSLEQTLAAVKAFQLRNGLPSTGVVSYLTKRAIYTSRSLSIKISSAWRGQVDCRIKELPAHCDVYFTIASTKQLGSRLEKNPRLTELSKRLLSEAGGWACAAAVKSFLTIGSGGTAIVVAGLLAVSAKATCYWMVETITQHVIDEILDAYRNERCLVIYHVITPFGIIPANVLSSTNPTYCR